MERISPVNKLSPWRTSGNQKCRGASPIFSAKAMERSVAEAGLIISVIFH